jgi:hypothetical protein
MDGKPAPARQPGKTVMVGPGRPAESGFASQMRTLAGVGGLAPAGLEIAGRGRGGMGLAGRGWWGLA